MWLLREHGMYSAALKPERLQGRLQAMYLEIHAPFTNNYSAPLPPKDTIFSDLPPPPGCYHISRMLFKGNFQDASYYDGLLNVENASTMMDSVNVDSSMHRVEYSSVK